MKSILISIAVLVSTFANAAAVLQSPWTITTDPPTARTALHAVAEMTGSATNLTVVSNNAVVIHQQVATPYQTLELAVAAATVGDTIKAAPITHICSNALTVPINGILDLTGAKIDSYAVLPVNGPAIYARDNAKVFGGFVDLKYRGITTNSATIYQAIIGTDSRVSSATATNVWVYDNSGVGETDCIFVRNTGKAEINLVSCNYTSRWDTLAFLLGVHKFKLWGCNLSAMGTNHLTGNENTANCIASETGTSGSFVQIFGGSLCVSNASGKILNARGGNRYEFHNVAITNFLADATVDMIATTGDTVVIDGTAISRSRIDDDAGEAVVIYQPSSYVGDFTGDASALISANATTLFGSGRVPTTYLGSGTANSTTVLYGDQTYKAAPTAGFVTPFNNNQFGSANGFTNLIDGVRLTNAVIWSSNVKIFEQAAGTVTIQDPTSFSTLTMNGSTMTLVGPVTMNVGGSSVNITGITTVTGSETVTGDVLDKGNVAWTNAAAANGVNMKWNQTSLWITNPASSVIFNGTGIAPGVITNNIYSFTNGGYMIAFNASGANAGVAIRPRAGVDAGPNFASTSITSGGASVAAGAYSINNDANGAYFGSAGVGKIGRIYGGDGSGANNAGGQVQVKGGASTGTARGGPVELQTSPSSASSSTLNTAITRTRIEAQAKTLTESSATTVVSVSVAASKILGIHVSATTRAADATDFQSVKDSFDISAVNKAGTVTTAISTIGTATTANAVSAGTLATTWTAVANGNAVDIKCSAVSSLTQTALETYYRIEVDTDDQTMVITPQ